MQVGAQLGAPARDISQHLLDTLNPCFATDTLELRRITWESKAANLEKVVQAEAVHRVRTHFVWE